MDIIDSMQQYCAMEGMLSNIRAKIKAKRSSKKSKPEPSTPATPLDNERFNSEYKPKIEALGLELSKKLQEKAKAENWSLYNFEFAPNASGFSARGSYTVAIFHWQNYDPEHDGPCCVKNCQSDEAFNDAIEKGMEYVEFTWQNIAKAYQSKAKAIHPKCSIKLLKEDIDVLYIDFDKAWMEP